MPYLKLCFPFKGRRVCARIQGRSLAGLNLPPSPDILFEVDGKEPAWAKDLAAVATLQNLIPAASSGVRAILKDATAKAVREVTQQLPEGVTLTQQR